MKNSSIAFDFLTAKPTRYLEEEEEGEVGEPEEA